MREIDGVCYLYKKVIERAHLPARMWEKIRLKGSEEQVMAKVVRLSVASYSCLRVP